MTAADTTMRRRTKPALSLWMTGAGAWAGAMSPRPRAAHARAGARLVILDARRDNPFVRIVPQRYKCRRLTKGTFCGQFILDRLQQTKRKIRPRCLKKSAHHG